MKPPTFEGQNTYSETFILGGPRTVATNAQQAFWANTFAKDILDVSRLTHMEATIQNWNEFYAQGRLGGDGEKIAILVDGSVSRPMTHVRVFGQIVMQEAPRNNMRVIEAVAEALSVWRSVAPTGEDGDYLRNLHVFADNNVWIDPDLFFSTSGRERLMELGAQTNEPPFYTIINTMPYAAILERAALPAGLAFYAFKKIYGEYSELAVRFRYYTADVVPVGQFQETSHWYKRTTVTTGRGPKANTPIPNSGSRRDIGRARKMRRDYSAGKPLSFPAINIGPSGSFNSGASPIIIKEALRK